MRYLTFLLITFLAGCDPCNDVTCENGEKRETDSDCECVCDEFYSGDACDEAYNKQFEGTYTGDQQCITAEGSSTIKSTYTIEAVETSPKRIRFSGLGITGEFTNEQGQIKIREQNLPKSNADESVRGDGQVGANKLRLNLKFRESDGGVRDCEFEGN